MNIIIDPEFQSLIRPLTDDEFRQLECSVLDDGLIDPLVVWAPENILLDGHHRYRVCQKYGLEVKLAPLNFNSRADARQWVINHQLGRRNVTPEEASYLRGIEYVEQKAAITNPEGKNQYSEMAEGQAVTRHEDSAAERLAKEHDVSSRTIKRDGKFAAALDTLADVLGEQFKADVLGAKTELSKIDIVALAEMPREEVHAKAGDYPALREAASAWRKARDEKPAGKSLGTPKLRGVIAEIERACGDCPNDRKGCRRLLRNIIKTAKEALRMKEEPADVAA